MFTSQTEAALVANMSVEGGQPMAVTLTPEAYREIVYAARQWDAFRSGINIPTAAAQLPIDLFNTNNFAKRTLVGAGDGNTYVVR